MLQLVPPRAAIAPSAAQPRHGRVSPSSNIREVDPSVTSSALPLQHYLFSITSSALPLQRYCAQRFGVNTIPAILPDQTLRE